jgi:hypothetical protein
MRFRCLFIIFSFLFFSSTAIAQDQALREKKPIRVIVKDAAGEKIEGYMFIYPDELTVSTKDNQEKSIPLKAIQSIKVERVPQGIPGPGQMTGEEYYSVRVDDSQEVYTLKKKYTFNLNTSLGMVTKTLDPSLLSGGPSSSTDNSFIRGKSVIFSLEFKF